MPELINRQSALSVCKEYGWIDDEDFIEGYNTAIKDIREAIKELPTIEPEVRHGRWIYRSDDAASCYCSECNEEALTAPYERNCIESDFCPNCGAKMDGGGEQE